MAIKDKILKRIKGYGRGEKVFSALDFLDIGSRGSIDVTLARLVDNGELRRVGRGLYDWPRQSKLLGREAPANTDSVIKAVQRRSNAKLLPENAAAANLYSLTTAVPVRPFYLTDGLSSRVNAGGLPLSFRPARSVVSRWAGSDAAPIVQALYWLRDGGFSIDEAIPQLRKRATQKAKTALLKRLRDLPTWAQEPARQIAEGSIQNRSPREGRSMTQALSIFGDEAGNTGSLLLDPDQRFFVYATVAFSNDEAAALIAEARAKFPVQMPELKGKKLMTTPRGRQLAAYVIERLGDRCAVNAHDKVVALCGYLFEYLYEPVYQFDPSIFYQKDLHRFVAMYAFTFFTGPDRLGPEALDQFQKYMRSLDEADAPLFFGPLKQPGDIPGHPFQSVLTFARGYRDIIIADNKQLHGTVPGGKSWVLDLAASGLWSHLNHWGRKGPPLKVICDESKPLEAIAPHLDGSENDPAIKRARTVMKKTEPLGWKLVEPIAFGNSKDNPAIQLADILASATYYLLTNGTTAEMQPTGERIDKVMLKDSIFPDWERVDLKQRTPAVNYVMLYHLSTLAEQGANPYAGVAEMYKEAEIAWVKGELPVGQD